MKSRAINDRKSNSCNVQCEPKIRKFQRLFWTNIKIIIKPKGLPSLSSTAMCAQHLKLKFHFAKLIFFYRVLPLDPNLRENPCIHSAQTSNRLQISENARILLYVIWFWSNWSGTSGKGKLRHPTVFSIDANYYLKGETFLIRNNHHLSKLERGSMYRNFLFVSLLTRAMAKIDKTFSFLHSFFDSQFGRIFQATRH